MNKTLTITLLALSFLLVCALYVSSRLYRKNQVLTEALLSSQATQGIPKDFCEYALAALNSGDPKRMTSLKSYLSHCLQSCAPTNGVVDIPELARRYRANEYPERSNYFADLVIGLSARTLVAPLEEDDVVAYLGEPDFATDHGPDRVFFYKYKSYDRDWMACVRMEDGTVAGVGLNDASAFASFHPHDEQNERNGTIP
jgi:hypothetical protein